MTIKKIKPISPSLREKKRYLAFEIISKEKIEDFKKVSETFQQSFLGFLGELGLGRAGIWLLKDKFKGQRGLIKVNHKYVDELKAALSFIKVIDNEEVLVRSLGVSGILNKAETRYLV